MLYPFLDLQTSIWQANMSMLFYFTTMNIESCLDDFNYKIHSKWAIANCLRHTSLKRRLKKLSPILNLICLLKYHSKLFA
jgi:hypothetical protein